MSFWLHDREVEGPYTVEGFLSRTGGNLNVLAACGEKPPKDRWGWRPAFCFPEFWQPQEGLGPLEKNKLQSGF